MAGFLFRLETVDGSPVQPSFARERGAELGAG
jgi:hypothetical protein